MENEKGECPLLIYRNVEEPCFGGCPNSASVSANRMQNHFLQAPYPRSEWSEVRYRGQAANGAFL